MLADEGVFSVDDETYCWRDVLLAAAECGDWRAAEARTRHGAACVRHAQTTADVLPPGALEIAGREFRYPRDLITAASMEDWLARWGLAAKAWTGSLRRELNAARWPGSEALVHRYAIDAGEAARLTLIDAICDGDLERWARSLALRAAAAADVRDQQPADDQERPADAPLSETLRLALEALGADAHGIEESSRRARRLDAAFSRFRDKHVTARAVDDLVKLRRLEWVRFDCQAMLFPDRDMAAEAALLLSEDGEEFTTVYRAAHAAPRAASFYFDALVESVRDRFLAARTGDLVGPVREGDEYALYLIQDKLLPDSRDPEVHRRAEEEVLQHALEQQLDRRVRWHTVSPAAVAR